MDSKKKWAYLAVGTVMLLFIGLIYGWSIFSKHLGAIFTDWDKTQLQLPFTLSMVFFCLGGFTSGILTKKIQNRYVALISAVFLFCGFFLLSHMLDTGNPSGSIVMLDIFYGVLNGFGVGLAYNAILSAVTPWFPGRTGIASGILLMGFGVGALALGGLVTSLVESIGMFRTFSVLGSMVAGVLAIGSIFLRKPDAPLRPAAGVSEKQRTAGENAENNADNKAANNAAGVSGIAGGQKDFTLGEATRTPVFWLFFVWNILIASGGLLVIGSAAQIAESFGAAAVLGLIVSVFNGVGRPVNGTFYDTLGRKKAMVFNTFVMLGGGLALLGGVMTGSAVFVFIGLPLIGISYGGSPALLSAATAGFFGQKNYAVNFAAATFCLAPAAAIGPIIASKLQESAGGAYHTTFAMIIILALLAFAINAALSAAAKRTGLE
ncbi:MAG: MFS transporter [Clostridiales Family XIII bacterium]|jgi:OFA family oxalate/formate antiporter-like MFS transporter|nr:MFS transporter [Clostridiales Family XIII bacterium]